MLTSRSSSEVATVAPITAISTAGTLVVTRGNPRRTTSVRVPRTKVVVFV